MNLRHLAIALFFPITLAAQDFSRPPAELPPRATTALATSLERSKPHRQHVWRDTAPINADRTVNAFIEIGQGDRRKFEFDMAANALKIDRMIPEKIGGYAVNYGYVPQTVSYDGDPYDALVLGPPLTEGALVKGVIVGLMYMEDEKGIDSKTVLSRVDANGRPLHQLTPELQREIGDFFKRYKLDQPGLFSKVPGWGTAAEGLAYIQLTHRFFLECRNRAGSACTVAK